MQLGHAQISQYVREVVQPTESPHHPSADSRYRSSKPVNSAHQPMRYMKSTSQASVAAWSRNRHMIR